MSSRADRTLRRNVPLRRAALAARLAAAALLCAPSHATPESFDSTIRVGLHAGCGVRSVAVELMGGARVEDLATGRPIGHAGPGPVRFELRAGRVCLGDASSEAGLRLVSGRDETFRFGRRAYPGALEVWSTPGGLDTIDEPPLEEYVSGALRIEGSPSLRPEARKALAVAIRSYAERSRGKHENGLYDVCDTTHCQGYGGTVEPGAEWARQAARATAGKILTWDDRPIWALYSTDCGGATANNEDGGAGDSPWPYLRGVSAAGAAGHDFCAASPFHRWSLDVPLARIEAGLNRRPATRVGRLIGLAVARTDRFGRALLVRCTGVRTPVAATPAPLPASSGPDFVPEPSSPIPGSAPVDSAATTVLVKAVALRAMLGEDSLKSTRFTVDIRHGVAHFDGRGYGHGVGMCLFGANGMAKAGWSYRQILARYYSNAPLTRLYDAGDSVASAAAGIPRQRGEPGP